VRKEGGRKEEEGREDIGSGGGNIIVINAAFRSGPKVRA